MKEQTGQRFLYIKHLCALSAVLITDTLSVFLSVRDDTTYLYAPPISLFSLGRDTDYCSLNERFTIDVAIGARIINFFPDILKP